MVSSLPAPTTLDIHIIPPGFLSLNHTTETSLSNPFNQISPHPMCNFVTNNNSSHTFSFRHFKTRSGYFLFASPGPLSAQFYPALRLGRPALEDHTNRLPVGNQRFQQDIRGWEESEVRVFIAPVSSPLSPATPHTHIQTHTHIHSTASWMLPSTLGYSSC